MGRVDVKPLAADGADRGWVLVIGGEPSLPEVVAAALEIGLGCSAWAATSAAEGLAAARRGHPGLVVADLDELGADAGRVVAALRADDPLRPVVGIRARGWREQVGLPPVPGCAVEIGRPFRVDELLSAVAWLLRSRSSRARPDARSDARPSRAAQPTLVA